MGCSRLFVVLGRASLLAALAAPAIVAPMTAGAQPSTLSPPGSSPAEGQAPVVERYKVRVSEGSAWTTLQPESWLILDVFPGNIVVPRHATFTLNAITGLGKWWDHPATEVRACLVSAGSGGNQLSTCLKGESPTPDAPLQVVLPAGVSIHDVLFRVRWQERGQEQEATLRLPAEARPTRLQRR